MEATTSPLLPSSDSAGVAASSSAGVGIVVSPMELPTSARPTFFVHPLLFYRHCFRLTSQNDRVARVLVMSEHYVSYLCAPDGRATWTFHPSTVRSVHIMPTRDQALLTFRTHHTDLLLHFDEKLAADRINPPMATLAYFIFLLRRESNEIEIKEEQDLTALRQSKLVKARNEKGAEGFVRRLVDGLRGYYLLLQSQISDVKEELEQLAEEHGASVNVHHHRLLLQRRRGSTVAVVLQPLQVRPISSVSKPVGYHRLITMGGGNGGPAASVCVVADGELPLRSTSFRGSIVFFRRAVSVTTDDGGDDAQQVITPEVVDRIGEVEGEVERQLVPLHPTQTRVGDVYVDAFGIVYFHPAAGKASETNLEVVAFLPCVVESFVRPHETAKERRLAQSTGQQHRLPPPEGGSTSTHNRFALGSWAAVTLVPPASVHGWTPGGAAHSVDGGESVVRSPLGLLEGTAECEVPFEHPTGSFPGDAREHRGRPERRGPLDWLKSVDLHRLASRLDVEHAVRVDAAKPSAKDARADVLGDSALGKKVDLFIAHHRTLGAAPLVATAERECSSWRRVAVVMDFGAASATKMTPSDVSVSSIGVLLRIGGLIRFSAIATHASSGCYAKRLQSSQDLREARRIERERAREARSGRRRVQEAVRSLADVESFLDARSTLDEALVEYGVPWSQSWRQQFERVDSTDAGPDVSTDRSAAVPEAHRIRTLEKLLWLACERHQF